MVAAQKAAERIPTGLFQQSVTNVADLVMHCASEQPDVQALRDLRTGTQVTFRALQEDIDATAAALVANQPFKHRVAYLGERVPGPLLGKVMAELGQEKCPAALLVPLGTTVDELAVLHGFDVEARRLAKAHGIGRLDRAPQLCGEPGFAPMLKAAVEAHLAHIGNLGLR